MELKYEFNSLKVLELQAEDIMADENNFNFIVKESVFHHTEAHEYMMYLNHDWHRSQKSIAKELKAHNCTLELIEAVQKAKKKRATWLLLYR